MGESPTARGVLEDAKARLSGAFWEVSDGIRTRDRRDHNPELYQLSYAHQARRRI
jgi:hypothetical protein